MPRQTSFPRLMEPGSIGNVRLKNRILKAPQHTGLANPDGSVSERLLRYYRTVAEGGAGMVIVEYAWVDDDASRASPCQLGAAKMDHLPGLSLLAQTIQACGAKAALQLSHAGRQRFLLEQPKAASPVPWEEIYAAGCPLPQALTIAEIRQIVRDFGSAAQRTKQAGFDMVELHACHGYLISNFLSARNNLRGDWYGGSLENRMRFLLEVVEEIKRRVGPDYPICARISGTDYEPGGTTIEESIDLCRCLEALGVAAIHVSGGNHHTTIHEVSPMGMPLAYNTWAAAAIKKEVSVPVIASGSITGPELAESILADGKGDFISLGRPLWADPEWPRKVKEGRPEDIRPCIRCNDGCLARGDHIANTIWCTVNVSLCREDLYAITPAPAPLRVAVVGGGPAGVEAARVCALKGHDVTLFEKRQVGGALHEASIPEFKAPDFQPLIRYLQTVVEKHDIKLVEAEATAQDIRDGGFEAVIVATGGSQLHLDHVEGIDLPKVTTAMAVLHGEANVGERVAVVGAGMVGTEVGLLLGEQGKTVTFVELLDDVMSGVTFDERQVYEGKFAACDITNCCGSRLVSVSGEGIVTVDDCGRQSFIPADTVVLAVGSKPNRDLVEGLREVPGLKVVEAGDCVKPRKIFDAIHEGHLAARQLDWL